MELNELTKEILGAAFHVHTVMGAGLLESVYATALIYELRKRGMQVAAEVVIRPAGKLPPASVTGMQVAAEVVIPVLYEGVDLGLSFRADLIVDGRVILEIKSVQALSPIHSKQLLNYLKLTGLPIGLLLNFNTISLRDQIVRLMN